MASQRVPKLPKLLDRKIYKIGQTRGADDDEIYQNRVSRSSTVLIPWRSWDSCKRKRDEDPYESGFIVLISPKDYFGHKTITADLAKHGLVLGENALVFYETRSHWLAHNPDGLGWKPANSRRAPLGGQYVARVSATTSASEGAKINRGFSSTSPKGAGIRVYEYASSATNGACRLQLEGLFWLCKDSDAVALANGMTQTDIEFRRKYAFDLCALGPLLDVERLKKTRALNSSGVTVCPLCLEELSAHGFFSRMEQAQGREVHDITITHLNLFHIEELRFGVLNHRPYNLAWGHHHCNVVVKDSGIKTTLEWMRDVVDRNARIGYLPPANN
jgi:hypothetical protein